MVDSKCALRGCSGRCNGKDNKNLTEHGPTLSLAEPCQCHGREAQIHETERTLVDLILVEGFKNSMASSQRCSIARLHSTYEGMHTLSRYSVVVALLNSRGS